MREKILSTGFLLVVLIVSNSILFADEIHFRDGSVFNGRILEKTKDGFLIELEFGTMPFKASEVAYVVPEIKNEVVSAPGTSTRASAASAQIAQIPVSQARTWEEARRALASVEKVDADGKKYRGTAFAINPHGVMITNDHFVRNAAKVMVSLYNEKRNVYQTEKQYEARVLVSEPYYDLAVIDISAETRDYLPIAGAEPQANDPVYVLGNQFGTEPSSIPGMAVAVVTNKDRNLPFKEMKGSDLDRSSYDRIQWIQTNARIDARNSGGPLVNKNFEVLGLNVYWYLLLPQDSGSYALHLKHLQKFAGSYLRRS